MNSPEWIRIWQEKQDFLRKELATAIDPTHKFKIRRELAEAEAILAKYTLESPPESAPISSSRRPTAPCSPGEVRGEPAEPSSHPSSHADAASFAARITLADYLHRLREQAGVVTLAGDSEPRPLRDVFVDLEISHAGLVEGRTDDPDNDEAEERPTAGPDELRLEVACRRHSPLTHRPNQQTISPVSLLNVAQRVLVVGAAGTGKSTLLRWLAWRTAQSRLEDVTAKIPLWLRKVPSHHDFSDEQSLADELANRALKAVDLADGPSPAREQLVSAVLTGHCVLFIDGIDEAGAEEQAQLAPWLSMVPGQLVLASRPRLAEDAWQDSVQVTLHGIPALDAERMIGAYFPGEPWIGGFIEALRGLPDGRAWLEIPVLLGLAATLFRAGDHTLPTSTLELYQKAVGLLLRAERLSPFNRGDVLRPALRRFARERLAPHDGPPRISFGLDELPARYRADLQRTGLFEGTSRLRFAHLSLGEILAAEDDELDLAAARARLADTDAEDVEGSALETLPMAHAIRGPVVLESALEDARLRDLPDHRMLRLLLRSIGYGGDGVIAFCRQHADEIVRTVAERLQSPSGRFSDPERSLMDTAERALLILRAFASPPASLAAFAPHVKTRGECAAEAHAATWILGAANPTRACSQWEATIQRQARAIVRHQASVEYVRRLTDGSEESDVEIAIYLLREFPEHRPQIRPFLDHRNERIRMAAIHALREDPAVRHEVRERFIDEQSNVRGYMVRIHGSAPRDESTDLRLRWALTQDPELSVRSDAVSALADAPWALPFIRRALAETRVVPKRFTLGFADLRKAAIKALANDAESAHIIRQLLESNKKGHFLWDAELLRALVSKPAWRDILLGRLEADDVVEVEVSAMAGVDAAAPAIRRLLAHPREEVIAAAIDALVELEPGDLPRLLTILQECAESGVRIKAMGRLGKYPEYWPAIRAFLTSKDENERTSALQALSPDLEVQDAAFTMLHTDPRDEVHRAAVKVLATRLTGRAALREFFRQTRSRERYERHAGGGRGVMLEWTRAAIVDALGIGATPPDLILLREALTDPHPEVRASAIRALPQSEWTPSTQSLLADEDRSVCHAAATAMVSVPEVRAHLTHLLAEEQWALRIWAFGVLVDHEHARTELRARASDPDTPDSVRQTLLQPLLRDRKSLPTIRACVRSRDRGVRLTALRLLGRDAEVQRELRERIRDAHELGQLVMDGPALEIIKEDLEARPILRKHMDEAIQHGNPRMLAFVAGLLARDPEVRPRLRALLQHEDDDVRVAAIEALGDDREVRPQLLDLLTNTDKRVRGAAAKALQGVATASPEFLPLLDDPEKEVRLTVLRALQASKRPEWVREALIRRLSEEPVDDLRQRVLLLLANEPSAQTELRRRLHCDLSNNVRWLAARALGAERRSRVALDDIPSIAQELSLIRGRPADGASARASVWLANPTPLDLDQDPEAAELLLAWLCVRLTWASGDGRLAEGRLFGEIERRVERLLDLPRLVIRVAMDVSNLPRERDLRPTHNLMETWAAARYLVSSRSPMIVLACADVGFEHLAPPTLRPGELLWGPTFFGFRLHDTAEGAIAVG